MTHVWLRRRTPWFLAALTASLLATLLLLLPAVNATAHRAKTSGRPANHVAHPGSLLSVPYLPHGPKNQLVPGMGSTRRVKPAPSVHALHGARPAAVPEPA